MHRGPPLPWKLEHYSPERDASDEERDVDGKGDGDPCASPRIILHEAKDDNECGERDGWDEEQREANEVADLHKRKRAAELAAACIAAPAEVVV